MKGNREIQKKEGQVKRKTICDEGDKERDEGWRRILGGEGL